MVALDESERWIETIRARSANEDWSNVECVLAKVQEAELDDASFDLVYARWVLSFLPDLEPVLRRLARSLAPGGVLAIQDYNHEGVSLFPPSAGFDAMIRATRTLYDSVGGDTWIAGKLPRHFREVGLELVDETPHVLSGGPGSDAFRWADAFFPDFSELFEQRGLVTADERRTFLSDWEARRADLDARFYSPIVVDIAGRRPDGA